MQVFTLRFFDDAVGVAKRLEFKAPDTSEALIFAHRQAVDRDAELWLKDARLCSIRRVGAEQRLHALMA